VAPRKSGLPDLHFCLPISGKPEMGWARDDVTRALGEPRDSALGPLRVLREELADTAQRKSRVAYASAARGWREARPKPGLPRERHRTGAGRRPCNTTRPPVQFRRSAPSGARAPSHASRIYPTCATKTARGEIETKKASPDAG